MSFACTCICDERGFGIIFLDTETNTFHCQPCQTQTEYCKLGPGQSRTLGRAWPGRNGNPTGKFGLKTKIVKQYGKAIKTHDHKLSNQIFTLFTG